ncbi:MAG: hypothetical protein V1716_01185 [Candidatus Uhrbacteria bacterium]
MSPLVKPVVYRVGWTINLTVPTKLNKLLFQLAKRDQMSVSAKTLELVKKAIEVEEDEMLIKIAKKRLKNKRPLIPFEKG